MKFVSTKVLEKPSTPYKLIKEDLSKKDVCLPTELVNLGIATKQKLKSVGASRLQIACSNMLKAI